MVWQLLVFFIDQKLGSSWILHRQRFIDSKFCRWLLNSSRILQEFLKNSDCKYDFLQISSWKKSKFTYWIQGNFDHTCKWQKIDQIKVCPSWWVTEIFTTNDMFFSYIPKIDKYSVEKVQVLPTIFLIYLMNNPVHHISPYKIIVR